MSDERRRSRRFSANPDQDAAILTYRRKEYVAKVIDLSAEGFRVCIVNGPQFEVGAEVKLETPGGRFTAAVMNVDTRDDGSVFAGLKRLSDQALSGAQRVQGLQAARKMPQMRQPRRNMGIVWIIVIALIIGAVIGAMSTPQVRETLRRYFHSHR